MAEPDRRRRSRSGQVLDGVIWGAALGAASGAVLGAAIDGLGAGLGAFIGAALYAPAEVITSIRRGPAEPKPLWYRILSSVLLMAVFGWLLGLIYDQPFFIAIVSGALIGLLGLRPGKALLGLLVGAALGALFQALDGGLEPALVAATVALTYRVIAAIAYRGRELVRVMAGEVPASALRYVVPFEARSRYVGGDYVEQLAKARGGSFRRNPPDVGILASLDSLEGPTFEASRVHPLIREFYEHTSRFRLSIVPEWRRWMKPGYELSSGWSQSRSARRRSLPTSERPSGGWSARSTRSPWTAARRSTSAAGSGRSRTRASRSMSASTRASGTRTAAT
jgi:hypothetical protein